MLSGMSVYSIGNSNERPAERPVSTPDFASAGAATLDRPRNFRTPRRFMVNPGIETAGRAREPQGGLWGGPP